jgi:D-alanyl-D-alanine carboxypeptidase (penicillin-binding protein 5/6)
MRRLFTSVALTIALACSAPAATKKSSKSSSSAAKKPAATKVDDDEDSKEGEEKKEGNQKKELAPGELPLFARSAMLLDAQNGNVLYEKNPDALEYPASATKILTALIVIEAGDLDKMVTVELADTKVEPSALYIKPGETYPRRHLLYALLLKSANDVAMCLARDNAGSIEAFAERMTQRAHALGADSSHFKNPHGLHDPHHYTTARDLARIGLEAMKNSLFREIVATPEVWLRKADEWILFRNHNRLLGRMAECIGVKTGYTRPAQQVLVSAAAKSGKEVISVVLHTNKPGIWDDSKLLLEHGLTKLTAPPPPPAEAAPAPAPAPAPASPTASPPAPSSPQTPAAATPPAPAPATPAGTPQPPAL